MRIEQFTSIGNRSENQDFIAYQQIGYEEGIFVVADGMGGYENGAIAAKTVAEAIVECVSSNWGTMQPSILLKESITNSNECLALKKLALDCKKMGCCICVLLITDSIAYLTWFGDCRVYIYRNGLECYHTRDHSAAVELAQIRTLNADDVEKYENIVTRSIMGNETLDPMEIQKVSVRKSDAFLLCTDGIHKSIHLPLRMPEDIIDQLKDRGDRYTDNATCLKVTV